MYKEEGKYDPKQKEESIKTEPEVTQILEMADKDIKIAIITLFHMFKELSRDMKDIKTIK